MLSIFLDSVKPENFYLAQEFIVKRLYYFDKLDIPHTIVTNLEEYLKISVGKKIAVLHNNFTHSLVTEKFLTEFPKIYEESDLIFLVESENPCENIKDYINLDKLVFVSPGVTNDSIVNNKIIFKPTWFEIPVTLYKQLSGILNSLTPYSSKPKFFDALLGVGKPHRDLIYDSFDKYNLTNKNVINYHQRYSEPEKNSSFILEPGTSRSFAGVSNEDLKNAYSVVHVEYHGILTHLACIISISIYNQTAYSIVAETNCDNEFHLFTEKITKPILGRRLFVVFAGQGYLKSLKSIGFKTFSDVIDESYDSIIDPTQRWNMAFDQVRELCNRDQQEVLAKIRPIVDHNYRLLVDTDWTSNAISQMISKVKSLTNTI
jgi:hypothetical protein